MGALAELRVAGFRVEARQDKLYVEPISALTDELRARIRANKAAILTELAEERPLDIRADFAHALKCGRLVVCADCEHFESRADLPDGHCNHFDVAAWGRVPFQCAGYVSRGEA